MEESYLSRNQMLGEFEDRNKREPDTGNPQNQEMYEKLCFAHLYVILTDNESALSALRELIFITRDKLFFIITKVDHFVTYYIDYFKEKTFEQIFWLVEQLIKLNAAGVDSVALSLLRQITCKLEYL
ncbi:Integrator complex subunit 3 [Thelohanellus kitauei]|uniref:Integrator complex subunit 3 n=1 Tax=Thelohanellus kitauei TaxID=669202 RepID=A0A0C2MLG8_THEKT|nr:Integrator complex subunit 3 [Thelohanellus kitauei]